MTNRKVLCVRSPTSSVGRASDFYLRAMGSSPIRGSKRILYVCTLYGKTFFLFLPIENVHHFSNIFQSTPLLSTCTTSDCSFEDFSCNPTSC